jgi:3-phosphoshikimate 1-carboxyvinyltransferase
MGCQVDVSTNATTVIGQSQLNPLDIDLTEMPDTAQTAAVLAIFAKGRSRIRGIRTLRVKETDRIEAVAVELRKMGASVDVSDDAWTITPPDRAQAASIATYDDHRMAMSFAVAGLRIPDLVIEAPECVAKTFPDFWDRWNRAFLNVKPI